MKKLRYSLISLLILLLLAACNAEESHGCYLPPQGFSESDLVGTWGGGIEDAWDSQIIIRNDGLYKQMINIERTGFKYDGDWQRWRVTYSEQGMPYLHLEGFSMCAYWEQVNCNTGQTGIEPLAPGDTKDPYSDLNYWYDGCQKRWVNTPGEEMFMVWGVPRASIMPERGIKLIPLRKTTDGGSGTSYELHESDPLTVTP